MDGWTVVFRFNASFEQTTSNPPVYIDPSIAKTLFNYLTSPDLEPISSVLPLRTTPQTDNHAIGLLRVP